MRKIFIIFLITTTIQLVTKGQNYFVTEIPKNFSFDIIQNNKKNFICITDASQNSYLYEISEEGDILKEKEFSINDSNIYFYSIIQQSNNNYLVFSTINKQNENKYKLALLELDEDFNILKNTNLNLPIEYESILTTSFCMKQANDSELICFGMCYVGNYEYKNFIYKISNVGDSIQFKIVDECSIYDLEIRNNKIYYYESYNCDEIRILNYNDLSEDTVISVPNNYPNFWGLPLGSIEFLNDSSFVLFGKNFDNLYNNYHAVLLVDTNYHLIKSIKNIGFPNFNPQAFQQRSMAVNKSNEIIVCTHGDGSIGITKLDSQLNKIWEYLYPQFNYFFGLTMQATDDGGCIMVGPSTYSNLVIKCDNNGNITSIDGKSNYISPQNVIVYPNPAYNSLEIDINQNYIDSYFEVFDIYGRKIKSNFIENKHSKIDISSLKKGVYIYKITNKENMIYNGKFIKQ